MHELLTSQTWRPECPPGALTGVPVGDPLTEQDPTQTME